MALGVRRQSEDCNSTAGRNAECTSETKPQGISIYNRANSGFIARSPEMHCKISVALARYPRLSKFILGARVGYEMVNSQQGP